MPFKHNAARRHHILRARYRVTNWPSYEAGLRRRGDLTFWVDEAALAGWQAPRRSTPGRQPRYSDLAIGLVLTLRLVFHLALRQAEGFARSVLQPLGMALPVPDHGTLSRRGRAFAGRQPRVQASTGPVHLVLDSTGLELFGQGEWCAAKHGRLHPAHGRPWPRRLATGCRIRERNHAETTMGRYKHLYKHLIGPKLHLAAGPLSLARSLLASRRSTA